MPHETEFSHQQEQAQEDQPTMLVARITHLRDGVQVGEVFHMEEEMLCGLALMAEVLPGDTTNIEWVEMSVAEFEALPENQGGLAECIGCGCDDHHACTDGHEPCHWLVVDYEVGLGVCSRCQSHLARWNTGDRCIQVPDGKRTS